LRLSLMLEAHHEVVGVTDHDHVARCHFLAPGLHPQIEDVMQIHVRLSAVRSPPLAACLASSPTSSLLPRPRLSAIYGSAAAPGCRPHDARRTSSSIRGPDCRRNPPHTTHPRDFPERVKITRPHHPFEGRSLEVLRHANMEGSLNFVLILPDGSKSLIPAEWTDFESAPGSTQQPQLAGSLEDLLRLHRLVDALLLRSADVPGTSGRDQESHAATEPELHRHPDPRDVPVGATRRRSKAGRHRDSGAPSCPSHPRPAPGTDAGAVQ